VAEEVLKQEKNTRGSYVHSKSKSKDAINCPVIKLPTEQRRSKAPPMIAARKRS